MTTAPPADTLAGRLAEVRARIDTACERAGRSPADVTLVAVSKSQPPEAVRAASAAGVSDFGENYLHELEAKRAEAPGARWHFLGRVQSNKAARLASVDLVHGLEPGRAASRLSAEGERRGSPVAVLLEVDFTGRRQGVAEGAVGGAISSLRSMPGLRLRGLMTVAPQPAEAARRWFARLRELRDRHAPDLPDLSMGMSGDFPVAVEEGATIVRIGTAIFGLRPSTKET